MTTEPSSSSATGTESSRRALRARWSSRPATSKVVGPVGAALAALGAVTGVVEPSDASVTEPTLSTVAPHR